MRGSSALLGEDGQAARSIEPGSVRRRKINCEQDEGVSRVWYAWDRTTGERGGHAVADVVEVGNPFCLAGTGCADCVGDRPDGLPTARSGVRPWSWMRLFASAIRSGSVAMRQWLRAARPRAQQRCSDSVAARLSQRPQWRAGRWRPAAQLLGYGSSDRARRSDRASVAPGRRPAQG